MPLLGAGGFIPLTCEHLTSFSRSLAPKEERPSLPMGTSGSHSSRMGCGETWAGRGCPVLTSSWPCPVSPDTWTFTLWCSWGCWRCSPCS